MKFYFVLQLVLGMDVAGGPYDSKEECEKAAKTHLEFLKQENEKRPVKALCVGHQPSLLVEPSEVHEI